MPRKEDEQPNSQKERVLVGQEETKKKMRNPFFSFGLHTLQKTKTKEEEEEEERFSTPSFPVFQVKPNKSTSLSFIQTWLD